MVVGPSGSGKSTLGLALAGLVPREIDGVVDGSLTIDGLETRAYGPGALAARVGLVFQDPDRQIVMDRTGDDTAFGLENRAWPLSEMVDRVPRVLASVGLVDAQRRLAPTLSGGQRQRLALAGVLAPRPGVLVLDEPTASLDPDGVAAFDARLADLRAARGATIVLVEHRASVAWGMADLVLALGNDGRPIALGPPGTVLADHRDRLAAEGIWLPDEPAPAARSGVVEVSGDAIRSDETVVEAKGLRFGYVPDTEVIRGVDLVIHRGERVALVGPNGGGKSTLARLLVGLLRPVAGSVRVLGDDPARLSAAVLADRVGLVFQEAERQFLTDQVGDEIRLGLDARRRAAVDPLMERIGLPLSVEGERSPYRLSGGQQRRLALATALVREPAVLVLDEPTLGQDRRGAETLVDLLDRLVVAGTSLIVATHDEWLLGALDCRVIRVDDGRIVGGEP